MERVAYCYRFGTAEFDEARFELRVAGLPVDVERRALEVLAYLLRHAGEVVTKEELLREVWAGRVTVEKVLPNAINKLRRALGEANADHISTQARIGYRLDGAITRTAVGRQIASELQFAAGQAVPGRGNFVLIRQLGRTAGSEVWLAEHAKTRARRVYKFALDGERLRSLKREATLMRVLRESLADTSHFVELIDWNFELSPYFLECEFGGDSLAEWAGEHLAALDTSARLRVFLQIADALAAAHSVGVLHKDLKPANVLVMASAEGPHLRLTDFGSGHLLDPDQLARLGITRLGMTVEDGDARDATSGTPLYIAPELFAGLAPTVRSDVFALGILLYQLLSGRIGQPMVSGWEADIADPLLREDLELATEGNPERRLSSAALLAERLRRLDTRRAEARERDAAREAARQAQATLARAQARRPIFLALFAVVLAGALIAGWLARQAVLARNAARDELGRATALGRFLDEDLIGRSNPLVSAKGPDTTLREALLAARDRVTPRFGARPDAEATVRASLAQLFNAIDLFPEAEAEARRALALQEGLGGPSSGAALQARAVLVRVLSRQGRGDEATREFEALEKYTAATNDPLGARRLAAAQGTLMINRGEFAQAIAPLRAAIAGYDAHDPADAAQRDATRLDLITALTLAGQDEQARAEGAALIAEVERRGGDGDLMIALARVALARAQGEDHAAAESLLLSAEPVIVARLGDNHTRHLQLLGELLGVAFRRGDWPRATIYAEQVHTRLRDKFGDAHPLTFVSLTNWARTLDEAGRPLEALDKLRESHARLSEIAGPRSPQTQDAQFLLAQIELELGRVDRAEPLIAGLDAELLESGRATGVWPGAIDGLRGMALARRGRVDEARVALDRALEALHEEAELDTPSRLYVIIKAARDALP